MACCGPGCTRRAAGLPGAGLPAVDSAARRARSRQSRARHDQKTAGPRRSVKLNARARWQRPARLGSDPFDAQPPLPLGWPDVEPERLGPRAASDGCRGFTAEDSLPSGSPQRRTDVDRIVSVPAGIEGQKPQAAPCGQGFQAGRHAFGRFDHLLEPEAARRDEDRPEEEVAWA